MTYFYRPSVERRKAKVKKIISGFIDIVFLVGCAFVLYMLVTMASQIAGAF